MPAIETFVVRFYRRAAGEVAGTVETVSDGSMASFVGLAQLCAILNASVPHGDRGAQAPPEDPDQSSP